MEATASKQTEILRNRKKSAKPRITKARKQLIDLIESKHLESENLASKTEIRKAVLKVESEYKIITKLISSLKEVIGLEVGEENIDINGIIETRANCCC